MMQRVLSQLLMALALISALAACQTPPKPPAPRYPAVFTGFNHTDRDIVSFSVAGVEAEPVPHYERKPSDYRSSWNYKGGGTVGTCCVNIPANYDDMDDAQKARLKAKVRWQFAGDSSPREAMVPIEPYSIAGSLWIHFMPDGVHRAVVSIGDPVVCFWDESNPHPIQHNAHLGGKGNCQ